MPTLNSLTFDASGLRFDRDESDRRIWFTPAGDGVSLNYFNKPPDLPSNLQTPRDVQQFYQTLIQGSPVRIVEADFITAAACRALRLILKSPQEPSGFVYLGS